ncbi:MAG: GTPase Era [Oscillospiraceae bacterium]|nr:GTPase Era [Oscillospiraceae bacterium]
MNTKTVFVSIVGRPNVGKSSLLNAMVGDKVAIVSDKPQTTRSKITGVLTKDETQLIFIDTPGMHIGKTKLSGHMVKAINQSIGDVDVVALVIEPTERITAIQENLVESIKKAGLPAILVVNKVDTIENKDLLLPLVDTFAKTFDFEHVLFTSAADGSGVDELIGVLSDYAQESVHYFPEDAYTDQPERVIVSEIIREKVLRNMHDEIPHGIAVVIERFHEREDKNIIDIDCTIYCEKMSHKGMIIGKGGQMLKRIMTQSRIEVEQFLDCKVNLQSWIKVKEDWRNKEGLIKNFGLNVE